MGAVVNWIGKGRVVKLTVTLFHFAGDVGVEGGGVEPDSMPALALARQTYKLERVAHT